MGLSYGTSSVQVCREMIYSVETKVAVLPHFPSLKFPNLVRQVTMYSDAIRTTKKISYKGKLSNNSAKVPQNVGCERKPQWVK